MTDTQTTDRIGNVPTARARRLIGELIEDADASGDPERYWTTVLGLVSSSMSAHTSHEATIRALCGFAEVSRIHRDQLHATSH